jgi:hypothetical protein
MTGAYLRVKRDDQWQNIEIDQMTDAELDDMERRSGDDPAYAWSWVKFLAKWIRDNVSESSQSPASPHESPRGA